MSEGQSRRGSLVEALLNVAIGFAINFVANLVVLPRFGFTSLTLTSNLVIGLIFTVISVARSYLLRRYANRHIKRFASWLA